MVMATQNPARTGRYLPPSRSPTRSFSNACACGLSGHPDTEREILALSRREALATLAGQPATTMGHGFQPLTQTEVFGARRAVLQMHLAPDLERYLLELILATREPHRYGTDLVRWIDFGASPRATIGLDRVAKAHAWLQGRDYVSPEDIQIMAPDVLRHRIIMSFEAEAEGVRPDDVIRELLAQVAVP